MSVQDISTTPGTSNPAAPLSWEQLEQAALPEPDRAHGPANAQATLRLFGTDPSAVGVSLYRDHHAWCPYCQKVWLWLEEKRIPYRVRKVTMFCYGEKEPWYRSIVRSGLLPAIDIEGSLITESDRILEALEDCFSPLGFSLRDPRVIPLRRLERLLFQAWCQWLCLPTEAVAVQRQAEAAFLQMAEQFAMALEVTGGPFLLEEFSIADLVFVPFLERMNASLAYYKGFPLRHRFPPIDRWFRGLESRSTYRGTQSDFHTHVHDLPPQLGGCSFQVSGKQQQLATRIDSGPWPILDPPAPDPESSLPEPPDAARQALGRVLRHRRILLRLNPLGAEGFDQPLRSALTHLVTGRGVVPPPGSAAGLRHLRDRISVPRDMPLHAARCLRRSLETTARLDPLDPAAQSEPIPVAHRLDQNPAPFLRA